MPSISRAKKKTKKKARKAPPIEIGWREWAELPDLGVASIKAKIDTGAKTSAIHAFKIKEITRGGKPFAQFVIHPIQRKSAPTIKCVAPVVDKRRIKSSNGMSQLRIVIATTLKMGDNSWPIEISLANRDEMGFRFLIGRDALRRRAVIHPGKSFMLGK